MVGSSNNSVHAHLFPFAFMYSLAHGRQRLATMLSRFWSRLNLQRAEEQLVLGQGRKMKFFVSTDKAFGGDSTASFDDARFFRGQLAGKSHFRGDTWSVTA